jgi:hypothetical protein
LIDEISQNELTDIIEHVLALISIQGAGNVVLQLFAFEGLGVSKR